MDPHAAKALRREYHQKPLSIEDVDPNPKHQFDLWFESAQNHGLDLANAMALATATPEGLPSVRMVLLKQTTPEGFVFFTDFGSTKGQHLQHNPKAELMFFWAPLDRQIRIQGDVVPLPPQDAQAYFASRPIGSQRAAIASQQSQPTSMQELQARYEALQTAADPLEMPKRWGGFCLHPTRYEFWAGRPNRLHDRIVYTPTSNASQKWHIERLGP